MLGYELPGSSGINEVRSQYGGFFLAMGVVQFCALGGILPLTTGLIVGIMTFGGLAVGRLVSVLKDGSEHYTKTVRALVFLDPLGFVLSSAAFYGVSSYA